MNNEPEVKDPRDTRFDAPDVSSLFERSEKLAERTREVVSAMTKISRRIHEAIAISDEHLRPRRPSRTADDEQV